MEQRAAGAWPSPVSAESLVGARTVVESVLADGDDVWWAEWRPAESGRTALVRWSNGRIDDVTPPQSNVRTSVHEYGGGAWWVHDGTAFYVEYADQRLRKLRPGSEPVLLTPEPHIARGLRYADGRVTPDGNWFVCVLERHHADSPPDNEIVAVATDGSGAMNLLAAGADFYAAPRVSPDGRHLVWVQWMHPNMPWDSTELWIGDLENGQLTGARPLAGNGGEALQEARRHGRRSPAFLRAGDDDFARAHGLRKVMGGLADAALGRRQSKLGAHGAVEKGVGARLRRPDGFIEPAEQGEIAGHKARFEQAGPAAKLAIAVAAGGHHHAVDAPAAYAVWRVRCDGTAVPCDQDVHAKLRAGTIQSATLDTLWQNLADLRRFLGVEGDFGKQLGLPANFVVLALKAVGNYGEIFERNVGLGSKLKLERGLNRQWTQGGLIYAPPFR